MTIVRINPDYPAETWWKALEPATAPDFAHELLSGADPLRSIVCSPTEAARLEWWGAGYSGWELLPLDIEPPVDLLDLLIVKIVDAFDTAGIHVAREILLEAVRRGTDEPRRAEGWN